MQSLVAATAPSQLLHFQLQASALLFSKFPKIQNSLLPTNWSPDLELLWGSNAIVLQAVVLIALEEHPEFCLVCHSMKPFDPEAEL